MIHDLCDKTYHEYSVFHAVSCFGSQEILDGLTKKNHETEYLTSTGAVVQAVLRHENRLYAKSDPRKWAYAAGY